MMNTLGKISIIVEAPEVFNALNKIVENVATVLKVVRMAVHIGLRLIWKATMEQLL